MDIFHEYLVERKLRVTDFFWSALICIAALVLIILSLPYLAFGITAVFDAAAVYFAYILISRFKVEYEYVLTNSSLDIDKIYAKRKRTRVCETDVKKFDVFAPVGDKEFASEENKRADVVVDCSTGYDKDAYYAIYYDNGKRIKLLFNPPSHMVESMAKFNPSKIRMENGHEK